MPAITAGFTTHMANFLCGVLKDLGDFKLIRVFDSEEAEITVTGDTQILNSELVVNTSGRPKLVLDETVSFTSPTPIHRISLLAQEGGGSEVSYVSYVLATPIPAGSVSITSLEVYL